VLGADDNEFSRADPLVAKASCRSAIVVLHLVINLEEARNIRR
jgi:hypothetical protein